MQLNELCEGQTRADPPRILGWVSGCWSALAGWEHSAGIAPRRTEGMRLAENPQHAAVCSQLPLLKRGLLQGARRTRLSFRVCLARASTGSDV